ncbi:MAG: hypothetical protein HDR80_11220 [Bacteroides sp.]|nr:hypothetical protein [Bacteroides sp.]
MGAGFVAGMSSNGAWGIFRMPSFDEEDAVPKRMNLTTGEIESLPLIPSQSPPHICAPYDITDDGTKIFGAYDDLPAYYDLADEQWHDLPLDFNTRSYTGFANDVTPDGRWACGYLMRSMTYFQPALWHDGECVTLGQLPTYDEMYEKGIIDDEDYTSHISQGQSPNIAFWKVSSDGKHVLASTDHNYPGWGCAYFLYHTETRTYDWIEDPDIPAHCYVSGASMSDNGEWVSARWTGTKVNPDGTWDDFHSPFRLHVPDGKIDYVSVGGLIGDDGRGMGLSVRVDGVNVRLETVMRQLYGLDIAELTGYDSFGTLFNVAADRRTVLCQPGYRTTAISAKLPESFFDAALKVNLMAEAKVAPEAGAVLSRPEHITVEFDVAAKHDPNKSAVLMKGDTEVARAASVESSQGGRRFTLNFPDVLLEEGTDYVLVLPEGLFTSASDKYVMPGKSIPYVGREDVPLAPKTITPEPESSLAELSTYSMVVLDFGMHVLATEKAAAYLYQEDSDKPLTYLNIAIDGDRVGLYPPARRTLAKGKEYIVVVEEGAFTDQLGRCANEEISVAFQGAYVLNPTQQNGNILFFDDFSNPNQSLYNFLQYEGDHLSPTPEMEAWGFDADNTPWNFSVRDEDDFDYCAAATSSYTKAGTSDDWMVLPRLSITNEYDYLTFKAQSYRLSADDRLKVYVWVEDTPFGELDAQTMARLKNEAELVFDRKLNPGRLEDRLSGDWEYFELPLSAFAGKDVYIAFANTNEAGSAIFVDDICVEYRGNFTLSSSVPSSVVGDGPVEISFDVMVNNDVTYSGLVAEYSLEGSDETDRMTIGDLNLGKGDTRHFTFHRPCSLIPGEVNDLILTVTLGDETQRLPLRVANPVFQAERGVLVEEGTGEWCGFCPSGFVALEYLAATYPGRVNEISIHHDDSYSFESYIGFMGFSAYPTGRVDRGNVMLAPLVADSSTGFLSFTSREGNETFADVVERQLNEPAEAGIYVNAFTLNEDVRTMTTDISVVPTLNQHDVDWNILTVVTEYDLPGIQQNYYSGQTDPVMASWSGFDSKVQYLLPAVARGVGEGGFLGRAGLLPNDVEGGREYRLTLETEIPQEVIDMVKCRVVIALVAAADGRVLNSVSAGYGRKALGLADPEIDTDCFEVNDGRVLFRGSATGVRIFDLQGAALENEALKGFVIAVHPDGGTRKIMVAE